MPDTLYVLEVWRDDAILGNLMFTGHYRPPADVGTPTVADHIREWVDNYLTGLTFDTARLFHVVPGRILPGNANPLTVRTIVHEWEGTA